MSSPVAHAMVLNSLPSYAFEDLASFSPANTGIGGRAAMRDIREFAFSVLRRAIPFLA